MSNKDILRNDYELFSLQENLFHRTNMEMNITMHLSVSSLGGVGHRVGILTFSKKIIKIHTPGQKRIVKISRNKWFTSLLLYKIER